jgi:hypothetical protein
VRKFTFWGAIAIITCLVNGAAEAAEGQDEAKVLFKEGVEHFKNESFEEAVVAFRKANELHPTWRIWYNVGQCEATLKRYGLALEAFEAYIALGGDEIPKDRQSEVIEEIARLRSIVVLLEISGNAGDEVILNGHPRGILPKASRVRVSMGTVQVQINREGETIINKVFQSSGGDTIAIDVDQLISEPEPAEGDASADEKPRRLWTWVAFGVGGAAAIGGGIVGGVGLSKANDITDKCENFGTDKNTCPADQEKEKDKARTMGYVTDALIGVAVAGIVAGTILYFVEPKRAKKEKQVALVPTVSANGAGLVIQGRF